MDTCQSSENGRDSPGGWQRRKLKCHLRVPQHLFIYFLKQKTGTSLMVQWLGLHIPNAGGPSLIPAQGTRSRMPQLRPVQPNIKNNNNNKDVLKKNSLIVHLPPLLLFFFIAAIKSTKELIGNWGVSGRRKKQWLLGTFLRNPYDTWLFSLWEQKVAPACFSSLHAQCIYAHLYHLHCGLPEKLLNYPKGKTCMTLS